MCLARNILLRSPNHQLHAHLNSALCETAVCVVGADVGNNDNVDVGGNQVALDAGNTADQINAAGRKKLLAVQANGQSS